MNMKTGKITVNMKIVRITSRMREREEREYKMTPISAVTTLNSQLPVGQAGGILDKRDTDEVFGEEAQKVFQGDIKPVISLVRCS